MTRLVTLFSGQWADVSFENFCEKAKSYGYDGIEIACWGEHLNLEMAATDAAYVEELKNILKSFELKVPAIGTHFISQCVGSNWDARLDAFTPSELAGKPDGIRNWAIKQMKYAAAAAKNMGVKIVTGLLGSPINAFLYSFPKSSSGCQTAEKMIDDAYKHLVNLWSPIFDDFDKNSVKFAFEIHPSQIAFDYYTSERLLKEFKNRKTLGFTLNPSHLIWQGVNPCLFIRDFAKHILHVHIKDAAVNLDGKAGILGSFLNFGDVRRGWNFRSPGHGDVDFENLIRELNSINYKNPLSVVWEDSDINKENGVKEALTFVKNMNFSPSDSAFYNASDTSA